jgi:hypothetical protein
MRWLIIAAAIALAATPARAQRAAPAPAPESAIAATAEQNGQPVEANIGGGVAIQLTPSASAGSNSVVTAKPDFLAAPEMLTGPATLSARPLLGASSWQVYVFPVTGPGSGALTLEKRERGGAASETFTVNASAVD